jgi:2-keto-3-deoxy-L-rhamnonate aldolase RhmA
MGYPGQVGHEKVHAAFETVAKACKKHKKILGMGGVYDEKTASAYIGLGASFVLAGADHGFLMDGATKRAEFLRGLKK